MKKNKKSPDLFLDQATISLGDADVSSVSNDGSDMMSTGCRAYERGPVRRGAGGGAGGAARAAGPPLSALRSRARAALVSEYARTRAELAARAPAIRSCRLWGPERRG